MALDASLRRVGCDAVSDAIENLKTWLRSKLQPDDYAQLESLVAQVGGGEAGGEAVDPQGAKTGHEDPQPAEDVDLPEAGLSQADIPLTQKYGWTQFKSGERVPVGSETMPLVKRYGQLDAIEGKKVPSGEALPKEKLAGDSKRKGYADRWPDASKTASASGGSFTARSDYSK